MSRPEELAGANGVTRWTQDAAVPDLEEQLRAEGRNVVLLDGTDVEDKAGFLRVCEQVFALPDWFGRNWDALEESLADLDISAGLVVLWSGWELFAQAEPDEYATALDIFSDAARRYEVDGISFVVLLLDEEDADDAADGLAALDDDPDAEVEIELDDDYDAGPAQPADQDPAPG